MTTVISIVEGDGEVAALPVLLRRLAASPRRPENDVVIKSPIRVRRDQFLNRHDVFEKMVKLAGLHPADHSWILILLDADDDCPVTLATSIGDRVRQILPRHKVSVVIANREFEAWFIAAARSLDGRRGFAIGTDPLPPADDVCGAKEWLSKRIANGRYREVTDQPGFAGSMDLSQAEANSRSFRKLCSEWNKNVA